MLDEPGRSNATGLYQVHPRLNMILFRISKVIKQAVQKQHLGLLQHSGDKIQSKDILIFGGTFSIFMCKFITLYISLCKVLDYLKSCR